MGLESYIIKDWKGWDQQDLMCFTFYEAVLLQDVKGFKAGTLVDDATFDYGKSELTLELAGQKETVPLLLIASES